MPKCKPCLGDKARGLLVEAFPGLRLELERVTTCPPGVVLQICSTGTGRGRGPSAYNSFIGDCMRGKVKSFADASRVMKQCAATWKEKKRG